MTYSLSPVINGIQFLTAPEAPLSGGLVYSYVAGTTTDASTYADSSGTNPNSNPIVLDSSGRPRSQIWIEDGTTYDFLIKTPTGTTVVQYDDVTEPASPVGTYGKSVVYEAGVQFFNNNGTALSNGLIYTYFNGSNSVKAPTWTSISATTQNSNPIVLDANGQLASNIYLRSDTRYNFVLTQPNGTVLQVVNDVVAIADTGP